MNVSANSLNRTQVTMLNWPVYYCCPLQQVCEIKLTCLSHIPAVVDSSIVKSSVVTPVLTNDCIVIGICQLSCSLGSK